MRPKKIYLNPKTIDGLKETDGEGKTMRVRAFRGKNDAEYTDVSQMWHETMDGMNPIQSDVLVQLTNGDFVLWASSFLWGKTSIELMEQYPDFKRWMWCKDLEKEL